MKKFNKLQEQLENLQLQKKNLSSIEELSLFQFIKYKNLHSKQKKITNQIQKISNLGKEINFLYDTSTKSWINNPKINCRKYCRLEKKANYKKEKKLYNLGLTSKKPIPLAFQGIYNKIRPISYKFRSVIKKYNPFTYLSKKSKQLSNKFNYIKSYALPKALNNLFIFSAKKCISGYRSIEENVMYFRNCISNTNSVKYLKSVRNEAIRQLSSNTNSTNFRDSIRVTNSSSIPVNRNFQHIQNKDYDIDYYL